MFEQEVEMEKRQSSVVPLLLIVALTVGIVAVAAYYIIESRKVLTMPEATNLSLQVIQSQGPATLGFHTGMVHESVNERTHDPHYRLLEKIGLLKFGKAKGWVTPISLTPKGETLLSQISGVQKTKETDGTEAYVIPLAERKLVAVSRVDMTSAGRATVEFTWQWQTNALGESFEASGPTVQSFNTWDRATLIQKYGANFYHQGPTKAAFVAVKTDKNGWQLATE